MRGEDALRRRRRWQCATGADAPWQPDVVVLLAASHRRPSTHASRHRSRPHRLWKVRQTRRRRLHVSPRATDRRHRVLDRPSRARRGHAGAPRLGRHDRNGLGASTPPTGFAARAPQYRRISPSQSKRLPALLWLARNTGVGALLVRGLNAFARGATRLAVTRRRLPKEVRDGLCAPYDSWNNRRAVLRFVQDIPLSEKDPSFAVVREVGEHLSQFDDRPVLICWGERDFVFDDHFLRRWQQALPSARVHRFADCGHYVLEDAPDEIESLVKGFLRHGP